MVRFPAALLRASLALAALALTACSASTAPHCNTTADCPSGQVCRADNTCGASGDGANPDADATALDAPADHPDTGRGDAPPPDTARCPTDSRVCGTGCCPNSNVCALNGSCCPLASLCGNVCCGAGQVCEGAVCHMDCGTNTRCRAADGSESCCGAGEVCVSNRCYAPTTSCRDFVDCGPNEYCEPTLGRCLPQPGGEACQITPTGGAVMPTLVWSWTGAGAQLPTYNQVMMAPMVANMNDDNGDGVVNESDVPDVLFTTFANGNYGSDGVMRAVSGRDGSSVFDVTDPTARVVPGGQLAIGDIDNDGLPEVVACGSGAGGQGPLIAFSNTGAVKWRSTDPRIHCGQGAPAIADLDGDGNPEVFVRYGVVHGADGSLVWYHDCQNAWGQGDSPSHSPCDYTTAADLDGDGTLEVVGGNVAYRADGSTLWDRSADVVDGYPAVGDLDLDGRPEVIVVESAFHPSAYAGDHYLRALRGADGMDVWGPVDINAGMAPAGDVAADTVGGGGPPTVANFDDDPQPEIALAGAYGYVVFESDGTLKWFAPTHDSSSRKTGSSVFDFDGDGVAEAVYNDEYWMRVYDGRTGTVRYCECNTSATLWEYPLVTDVDNDGHAEIVLAQNDYAWNTCPTNIDLDECTMGRIAAGQIMGGHGIRVFASPAHDWVSTRRIWNQHTYHVTNVSESGAIPAHERANWMARGLNDFRQNVQPGGTNIPDLVPQDVGVDLTSCPDRMVVNFRVVNAGWAASPPGVPATVYADMNGTFVRVGTAFTTRALLPGEGELLSVPYPLAGRPSSDTVMFRVIINDPNDMPLDTLDECRPDNNSADTSASCGFIIGALEPRDDGEDTARA